MKQLKVKEMIATIEKKTENEEINTEKREGEEVKRRIEIGRKKVKEEVKDKKKLMCFTTSSSSSQGSLKC